MKPIKRTTFFHALMVALFVAGTGIGNYHREYYVTEIAAVTLIVTAAVALRHARLQQRELRMMLLCAGLPVAWVVLYALVFSARTGAGVFPSLAAQRGLAFALFGPVVYLLFRQNWSVGALQSIFVAGAVVASAYFAVGAWSFDLAGWLTSDDVRYKSSLVTVDPSRGIRLKGPHHVLLFVALYYLRIRWLSHRLTSLVVRPLLALGAAAMLILYMPRTVLVAALLSVATYHGILARRRRLANIAVALPLLAAAALVGADARGGLEDSFKDDWSYVARLDTYQKAADAFLAHPFVGMGHDSHYSVTHQDSLGELFHPSDIGLAGIAFQYGIVGVVVYLSIAGWITANLIKLVWEERGRSGSPSRRAFLWALLLVCLSILLASPVQAQFAREPGIIVASYAWAIIMVFRYQKRHPAAASVRGGVVHA